MKIKLLALGGLLASVCASLQGQTPVNKTPLLHLSFDSVSGTTVNNTGMGGTGMNGTLNGSASIVAGGKFGNCMSITGDAANSASCRVANKVVALNVGSGNFWTVAMWVQTSTEGACYAYQGDGGWADGNTSFYLNNGSGTGGHSGGVRYGQGWEQGTATINDGLWHHLVMTCSNTVKTLFVDGAVDPFFATGYGGDGWGANGNGGQFWVGGKADTGDGAFNLNGLIDEAYVFNQTLTLADVQGLYNNNTLPIVPVTVTANPVNGYRGASFTLTATVTPGAGTVTNITANLSSVGLSATANMVLSGTPNVFTNSFTTPTNAPIGSANVLVTAITTTDPFIGSGGATFRVMARPPTNATVVTQIANVTTHEYTEASFLFNATNDNPKDASFPMAYSWYKNNVLVSTNAMGPYFTFLTTPADNGAQIYAIARVADTNYSSITVTSAVATLTVTTGSLVYTNGLKEEYFANGTRVGAEIGSVVPGIVRAVTNADSAGGFGDNHARRYSGYFIPPVNGAYVFYVASDDDCDVFLSTDTTAANKRLIAQETMWSSVDNWSGSTTAPFGSASIPGQKRSDQWTNSVGETPYLDGITLTGGNLYYFETVMHNGSGGDNCAVTFQTKDELALDPTLPLDGTASRMSTANNNIALITWPGTNITWALQPLANVTVYEGGSTNITCRATSDAEMAVNYTWYLNGAVVGGNSPTLSLSVIPTSYDGKQIYAVASTTYGGLSITSSVCTLHVLQAVFEAGWVFENKWITNSIRAQVEAGTARAPDFSCVRPGFEAGLDNPSAYIYNNRNINGTLQQMGYFVAPSNGNYVFFITSHDDGDLFLSTDATPGNKRLIARESGWSNNWLWNQASGGGSVIGQKRSDQFTNSVGTPYATGIPLVKGQKYYMEVVHGTSGWGNEQVGVTYRIMDQYGTVTPPADGTFPNAIDTVVGMNAVRCSYVNFTKQPTNITTDAMGYATFSADGVTDSQYPTCSPYGYTYIAPTNALFFQWYRGTNPIAGATGKTLTVGPLLPSDNGAQFHCAMRALGYANDALQPIWANSTTATVSVATGPVLEPGWVTVDWWSNTTSRVSVENGSAGSPTFRFAAPNFESPNNGAPWDNYVNRVSGFFTAPSNGVYVFFVNSDDDTDLFISTNGVPANKMLIAQESVWSNPYQWLISNGSAATAPQKRSDTFTPDGGLTYPGNPDFMGGLPMDAGQVCWLEAVHHNGGGGNNFEATFKELYGLDPTNGEQPSVLSAVIGDYFPRVPWVAFHQQPASQTVGVGSNVTFSVRGTNAPAMTVGTCGNPNDWLANPNSGLYQWYRNGTIISNATARTYTMTNAQIADSGASFVCKYRTLGYANDALTPIWSNSLPAVLTVSTAPAPAPIAFSLSSGGVLSLSWPAGQGWVLQVQTNSLNVGISNNWVDVPGSSGMSSTNITLGGDVPTVFYRLKY